ncbi:hypothetical protein ACFQU2_06385 [Siccirubricoccus deserti]
MRISRTPGVGLACWRGQALHFLARRSQGGTIVAPGGSAGSTCSLRKWDMMGGTRPATAFDFAGLKRALESSDADALTGLYAEDAEMTIVDRNRPPSAPCA